MRAPGELASLTREDLATATSLLDARLVVGEERLFAELMSSTRRSIAPGGNANAFVRELRQELRRRHERFGDSLYLLEPNIKQGIGGLRDLTTAQWAAKARWSESSLVGPAGTRGAHGEAGRGSGGRAELPAQAALTSSARDRSRAAIS